jgi:hypothetical protein
MLWALRKSQMVPPSMGHAMDRHEFFKASLWRIVSVEAKGSQSAKHAVIMGYAFAIAAVLFVFAMLIGMMR